MPNQRRQSTEGNVGITHTLKIHLLTYPTNTKQKVVVTPSVGSIDSPLLSCITPHSLIPRLNLPFLQTLPSVAFLFLFRTDSMDSPDCLPILLNISVLLVSFSLCHYLVVGSVR